MAKSPCIDQCKLDKESGFCRGCGRTRDEIKGWKKLEKAERRQVKSELGSRLASIGRKH